MEMRACLVVLIGETTSTRKWIKYEIEHAMELHKGIVGVYIHGLKNRDGDQSKKGENPFRSIRTVDGSRLSDYVECFDSQYIGSKFIYSDIEDNLQELIEDAIINRCEY